MKELEVRMKELRAKEEWDGQDKFLDQAYQERMAQLSLEERDDDEAWDPIEDVIENERGNFVDLIRHFQWQEIASTSTDHQPIDKDTEVGPPASTGAAVQAEASPTNENATPAKSFKGKKKKGKNSIANSTSTPGPDPDAKSKMETKDEIRKRSKEGSKFKFSTEGMKLLVRGTIEDSVEITDKTPSLPDDEIDRVLEEITEIKQLLFCRICFLMRPRCLLHFRRNSVEEFLNEEVPTTGLRDLCLKMEQPGLQEVRDACTDLMRGDDEQDDDGDEVPGEGEGKDDKAKALRNASPTLQRRVATIWVVGA